ncbi:hypothetical protein GWI33_014440 [Rhynchophorus ferrugineus]|uniref:Uncharacterized protein n=1 Tax=Rhynchophorus ferrugineus TaxID=354439 RepID=A0A834I643_RHYFE|nr:hypothetical protein GWI33_014440 [Rhynchophorus ferrugineus]
MNPKESDETVKRKSRIKNNQDRQESQDLPKRLLRRESRIRVRNSQVEVEIQEQSSGKSKKKRIKNRVFKSVKSEH